MSSEHRTNYEIFYDGTSSGCGSDYPSATIEIQRKRKYQIVAESSDDDDGAAPTIVGEIESPADVESFRVEISSLFIPPKRQRLVRRMLSTFDFCECTLGGVDGWLDVAIQNTALEAVEAGHSDLRIVWQVEDVTRELYDEDEALALAATESITDGRCCRVPASRTSIENLRIERYPQSDSSENCRICLDELLEDVEVIYMPCSHVFHGVCITKWLEQSNMCPLCRVRV